MSYATAMSRMSDIEARLSALQPAPLAKASSGFGQVLVNATNRFAMAPEPLDNPVKSGINKFPAGPFTTAAGGTGGSEAVGARAAGGKITPAMQQLFADAARRHKVPVELLKAVARAESGFRADAKSPAGAQGIMQLMPATARGLGVTNPLDPAQSIDGGAKYLSGQLKRYDGDMKLALAAYNAGPGNVAKYGGVPPFPETQRYVEKVLGYAREFGLSMSNGLLSLPRAS